MTKKIPNLSWHTKPRRSGNEVAKVFAVSMYHNYIITMK